MKKKSILYITLKQSLSKLKIKQDLLLQNKLCTNFSNFLWKQKLIYGYSIISIKKVAYVYLKYDTNGNNILINRNFKPINIHLLYQKLNWEKHTFYIIKTLKGILTLKEASLRKIGGFLLFKFF